MKYNSEIGVILNEIRSVPDGFSTTNQLYGIAYILFIGGTSLGLSDNWLLQILKNRLAPVPNMHTLNYIQEYGTSHNYFVSHHYNFVLNLMTYVAIESYKKRHPKEPNIDETTKIQHEITKFLNHERQYLTQDEHKTVGFELITGEFLGTVEHFQHNAFTSLQKTLRTKRMKSFSSTLAFTPEGVSGIKNRIILSHIAKRGCSKKVAGIFILNAPETTIRYSKYLRNNSHDNVEDIKKYVQNNKGLPPFFKADLFDFFWMVELSRISGTLRIRSVKQSLLKLEARLSIMDQSIPGCFSPEKGFSIAKGFSLYDSDSTAMGIKALSSLKIHQDAVDAYTFEYYKHGSQNGYHTYKSDNRASITTIAHIMGAQIQTNQDSFLATQTVNEMINSLRLTDKWHTSKLYSLHTLLTSYTDLYSKHGEGKQEIITLLKLIKGFQSKNGGMSSHKELESTIEESCWAFISIYYLDKCTKEFEEYYNKEFQLLIQFLKYKFMSKINYDEIERLWVVKQTYSLNRISKVLINVTKLLIG